MKRRNDLLLIAGLFLAAALVWLLVRPSGTGNWAVVTVDGEEIVRCPLDMDQTVTVGGEAYNVLQIAGGEASVIEANCGDHTCVHIGAVSRKGETIVCLPHRLVVVIEGGGRTDFDATIG
ncbi:MAG: NusG domain II-containing protein [Oscillospiraceae bacterium]|nr:NusG domain II-containing protein [Oscillospiraceae bacterium]